MQAQTSTQIGPREIPCITQSDSDTTNNSGSLINSLSGDGEEPVNRSRTNISRDLKRNVLTPRKIESKTLEIKRVVKKMISWERAAKGAGVMKKGRSLPCELNLSTENLIFSEYVTRDKCRQRSKSWSGLVLHSCSQY